VTEREKPPEKIGWAESPLQDFCLIIQGQSPPGDTYNSGGDGLPFFQGKAEFGDLYPTPVKWCTSPTKVAERDDILISIRAPVGPTNLCPSRACIGRGLAAIRPLGGVIPRYVLYGLRCTAQALLDESTGSTFDAISGQTLREHTLPLAPLGEQGLIVAEIEKQFTRLDAAVAALKRTQTNLRRYRAAVLKAACEGGLVPTEAELARREGRSYETAAVLLERILVERRSRWETYHRTKLGASGKELSDNWKTKYPNPEEPDVEGLPPLPEGWTWATLSQLSEIQGGIQKQPSRKPIQNSYPFLRVANVLRGRLDLSDVHQIELFKGELERLRLEAGDLLIVEGNGSPAEIGRTAIWSGAIDNCVHQNHIIRSRLLGGVLPAYVAAYWNCPMGASRVLKVASSTSGLYTLSVSKVGRIPVPLPPLAEQQRIVAETERRLSVTDELDSQVEANAKRSERLRQSVLKSAYEGKLVTQNPNEEPASVLLERIRVEKEIVVKAAVPRGRRKKEALHVS
jgi:type I restriction enzyme, S subunit